MNDIAGDRRRILVARVVAGHDDAIGKPCSEAAHFRSLAAIAVTAATEDAYQFAAGADRPAQRGERFLDRVRRMRVVDDYQRRAVAAEALHASRRRLDFGQELQRALQLDATDQQGSKHAEHVGCVERADQPGIAVHPGPTGFPPRTPSRAPSDLKREPAMSAAPKP